MPILRPTALHGRVIIVFVSSETRRDRGSWTTTKSGHERNTKIRVHASLCLGSSLRRYLETLGRGGPRPDASAVH